MFRLPLQNYWGGCSPPVVTPLPALKTNRPSFFLILKLFHALIVSSVCYLRCMVVNINMLVAKWRITERDLLSDKVTWDSFSLWHGTHYLFSERYRCCDGYFPGFGKYKLSQLQTCSHDCTEALVHLLYLVIFNSFSVFNFPFFNFQQ